MWTIFYCNEKKSNNLPGKGILLKVRIAEFVKSELAATETDGKIIKKPISALVVKYEFFANSFFQKARKSIKSNSQDVLN